MEKTEILLIGGGGHCRSVIDVIESSGLFAIAGIVDKKEKVGESVLGYPIIGTDSDLPNLIKKFPNAVVTIGQIKTSGPRELVVQKLKELGATFPSIISSRAYISKHASLGEGTVVMHDTLINSNASIGSFVILNSKSLVEHDAIIEDFCHLSTGAIINGSSVLKSGSFVGSQAVIHDQVEVPTKSIIPAGTTFKGKFNE